MTGDITKGMNALIPSTFGAVTSANFVSERASRRRQARGGNASTDSRRGKLYSKRVEAGIVTTHTWTMIQALCDYRQRNVAGEGRK